MKVIKRNGSKVDFDPSKIELAILKAMRYGSGVVDEKCAKDISFDDACDSVQCIMDSITR